MEVDRFNAAVVLPSFNAEVERCHFYSVDLKMTGTQAQLQLPEYADAPASKAYLHKRAAARTYTAYQIGVSLFRKTGDSEYEVRPFNFLLCHDKKNITMDVAIIEVFKKNGVDFQKIMAAGMRYGNNDDEEEMYKHAEEPSAQEKTSLDDYTIAQQDLVCAVVRKVKALAAAAGGQQESSSSSSSSQRVVVCKDLPWFLRWTVESRLKAEHVPVQLSYVDNPATGYSYIVSAQPLSEASYAASESATRAKRREMVGYRLGFRSFWNTLVASKKPVVGYNCTTRLLFLMEMLQAPLPESYRSFKEQAHALFPVIYDTKTLCRTIPSEETAIKQVTLEGVYRECVQRTKIVAMRSDKTLEPVAFILPMGFIKYHHRCLDNKPLYEAAFDAYMSGSVFILLQRLYPAQTADVEKSSNIIAMTGCLQYVNLNPNEPDLLVEDSTFVVQFDAPLRGEELHMFLHTDAQATARRAAGSVHQVAIGIDFSVRGTFGKKLTKEFLVVISGARVSCEEIKKRIQEGFSRQQRWQEESLRSGVNTEGEGEGEVQPSSSSSSCAAAGTGTGEESVPVPTGGSAPIAGKETGEELSDVVAPLRIPNFDVITYAEWRREMDAHVDPSAI